jgi:FixJ family two-component response regulator
VQGNVEGLDLARMLQRQHGTTCIFVTAQASRAREARDAAIGVIEKPYSSDAVLGAVEYAAAAKAGKQPQSAPRGLELFR